MPGLSGGLLSKQVKVVHAQAALTAGSTTNSLGGTPIDMSGFDNVWFMVTTGATSTAVTLTAQAATTTTSSDFGNITFNSTAISANSTASNGVIYVDVGRITKRYVRCTLNSTGGNDTGAVVAILYGAHTMPTTNASTDVLASDAQVST